MCSSSVPKLYRVVLVNSKIMSSWFVGKNFSTTSRLSHKRCARVKCEATPSLWVLAEYMIFEIIRHDEKKLFFERVVHIDNITLSASPYETLFQLRVVLKASILGLVNVLGHPRRILALVYQTFNSKIYGDHLVRQQPATVDIVWEIRYDIARGSVQSLSLRFVRSDVS